MTDIDITDREKAIEAIKTAVANDDHILLGSILLTRELWAYDRGKLDQARQTHTDLNNFFVVWKNSIKNQTKKVKGESADEREKRLAARQFLMAERNIIINKVLAIAGNVQYATEAFRGDDESIAEANGSNPAS